MPALEKLLICSLSLFGGYFLYKRNQSSYKFFFFIDSFLYGIIFASCLLLFNSLIEPYINLSFRYIGFFQAALPEKLCAYIYLYIFIKKKDIRDIPALINVAIFFASGFAFLENIIYAYAISSSVIFMRLFSSVIVHIATCSLIAYFMGQYHLHSFKAERILYLLLAFFIPFFFHAAYDTLLISGGNSTYLIALELAGLIVLIEYTIAHSHYFPSRDELLQKKIFFDDWKILQKQPQYERWILKSMKKRNEDFTPLFRFHMSHARWLLFLITLFTSISAATFQNEVTSSLGLHLSREELITLLILYPALVCLQLFLNGSINPEYFRYSRISIPVMSEVQFL
ncbi:MAG: PrsW family intramembrane metalloprotease [Leptospiraceae bacterium]|nr:PrsW family intramembrane metalloprotease [Leptospiraceae bacterium]